MLSRRTNVEEGNENVLARYGNVEEVQNSLNSSNVTGNFDRNSEILIFENLSTHLLLLVANHSDGPHLMWPLSLALSNLAPFITWGVCQEGHHIENA